MNYDENMTCPVCRAKLFTDEVAFCPDCGAPHHKQCYLSIGHCAYAQAHGTAEQWQPPKITPPQEKDATVSDSQPRSNTQFGGENTNQENPFFASNGIDKNENIGGTTAESIAKFVGYNALRYLRIFRKMANKQGKISWNWLGFLLPELWLASRKCYFQAILVGLYSVLYTSVYSIGVSSPSIQAFMQTGIMNVECLHIMGVLFIVSLISVAIKVGIGLFGDLIYRKKVYSTIKQMKSDGTVTDLDYMRIGGVNLFVPMLLYMGEYVVSMLLISLI